MVHARNSFYIIGIKRSEQDKDFDQETYDVQQSIVELVNDRMNTIYDIISKNVVSYGEKDAIIKELYETLPLPKDSKFLFINNNRPKSNFKPNPNSRINYISINSKLVKYVCPVLNYYTIKAYLSDTIVKQVEQLPNIIYCEESKSEKLY
ncbi:hypothetical protein BCR36DRAFT_582492 [Piromyces finnis]|uniref:Uncharacterized protein n=1 Tax=Piromyces finnis TaxID=1754191 RepID=A0A1Y1VCD8_9FUNG|nr:hypothetical protein BCR36DRAFT_582492 [Piromyces finnis]|eukprot:ORX52545.1 hypothetical protein BCR36DRAFT_582492 [Piromyces finnis]